MLISGGRNRNFKGDRNNIRLLFVAISSTLERLPHQINVVYGYHIEPTYSVSAGRLAMGSQNNFAGLLI